MIVVLIILILFFIFVLLKDFFGRDYRGFDRKGMHKNGTKFDDQGYDVKGFDRSGYNKSGFDKNGYDQNGFNEEGYKIDGRNANGRYNRLYDKKSYIQSKYNREGFLNPQIYPVTLTNHARERIYERVYNSRNVNAGKLAREAYAYGKSSCQVMKTSSDILKEIENRHENGIALLYNGYVFIFSEENVLITMYKNEKATI